MSMELKINGGTIICDEELYRKMTGNNENKQSDSVKEDGQENVRTEKKSVRTRRNAK